MRSAEEVRAAELAGIRQAMERTQTATMFYLDGPAPVENPALVDLRSESRPPSLWDRLTGGGS
jgi:rubrerythrin